MGDHRNRSVKRVRATQERGRARLTGDRAPANERHVWQLARASRREIPRRADGSIPFAIEISPLFALDAQELKSKIEPGLVVERPLYLR